MFGVRVVISRLKNGSPFLFVGLLALLPLWDVDWLRLCEDEEGRRGSMTSTRPPLGG